MLEVDQTVLLSALEEKSVIDVVTGENIGNIVDIEIDLYCGTIKNIVVADEACLKAVFIKAERVVISWGNIVKIGVDVILVRADDESCLMLN